MVAGLFRDPLKKTTRRIAFASLWLFLIGGVAAVGLPTTRLACSRASGEAAACTFTRSGPLGRTVRFAPGAISAVEVAERAEGKKGSPPRFAVLLLDQRGAETEIASFARAELSQARRDELRAFLADGARASYVRETAPGVGAYALFLGAGAAGISLLVHTLWRARHDRLAGSRGSKTPIDGASASPPTAPTALIPGALGDRLRGARPWLLFLFGTFLVAGVGNLILRAYADRHQGWLEIHAESRCRFDGGELLPGGVMTLSLDPGSYTVEVYNSRVPGNWQLQRFDVRLGQTTRVRCSPAPE
jgi:hypothetical protein